MNTQIKKSNRRTSGKRPLMQRDKRRGSVMVEFSLAFVAFLTMLLGMVELGRAIWTYSSLTHATFEGARFATVHGSENRVIEAGTDKTAEAIEARVKNNAVGLISDQVSVNTVYTPDHNPGSGFTVTASYPLTTIFGKFFMSSNSLTVRVQTQGVILH